MSTSTKHILTYITACLVAVALFAAAAGTAIAQSDPGIDRDNLSSYERSLEREAPVPDSLVSLGEYLSVAAEQSTELRAAYYRWHAAVAAGGYAGAMPDPQISYAYFVEQVETRVGPQNHRISLRQTIPWFGSLGAKKDVAQQAARSAYEQFEAAWLDLEYRVKQAYYELYFLKRNIAVTDENLELLVFWEELVRTRYKVALTNHPDVIRAQVELGKLEDRLRHLESMVAPVEMRLRTLLNINNEPVLATIDSLTPPEVTTNADSVLALVQDDNPRLSARSFNIERARASLSAVGRDLLPDFTLGVDYIMTGDAINPALDESGKDPWIVSVGFNLPLWFGKNSARKQEAEASLKRAQYEYETVRNDLRLLTSQAVFEHDDALRRVWLYRGGLLPKAEQALNVIYSSYQSGESDFLALLDAQRQLLEFRLAFERALTDLAVSTAELDVLTGKKTMQSIENNSQTNGE